MYRTSYELGDAPSARLTVMADRPTYKRACELLAAFWPSRAVSSVTLYTRRPLRSDYMALVAVKAAGLAVGGAR
jgi:preprotein translocase subunit Sss1